MNNELEDEAVIWRDGGEDLTPAMAAANCAREVLAILRPVLGKTDPATDDGPIRRAMEAIVAASERLTREDDRFSAGLDAACHGGGRERSALPSTEMNIAVGEMIVAVARLREELIGATGDVVADAQRIDRAAQCLRDGRAIVIGQGYERAVVWRDLAATEAAGRLAEGHGMSDNEELFAPLPPHFECSRQITEAMDRAGFLEIAKAASGLMSPATLAMIDDINRAVRPVLQLFRQCGEIAELLGRNADAVKLMDKFQRSAAAEMAAVPAETSGGIGCPHSEKDCS